VSGICTKWGGGSGFAKDAAIGATVGAGSSVAFGAMAGGGRSVYRSDQVNDQIYANCMIERGYKILDRN